MCAGLLYLSSSTLHASAHLRLAYMLVREFGLNARPMLTLLSSQLDTSCRPAAYARVRRSRHLRGTETDYAACALRRRAAGVQRVTHAATRNVALCGRDRKPLATCLPPAPLATAACRPRRWS